MIKDGAQRAGLMPATLLATGGGRHPSGLSAVVQGRQPVDPRYGIQHCCRKGGNILLAKADCRGPVAEETGRVLQSGP